MKSNSLAKLLFIFIFRLMYRGRRDIGVIFGRLEKVSVQRMEGDRVSVE